MIGWLCPAAASTNRLMLLTSILTLSVISWLWCTRGSSSMRMPTSWYWNEVIGTMPP